MERERERRKLLLVRVRKSGITDVWKTKGETGKSTATKTHQKGGRKKLH